MQTNLIIIALTAALTLPLWAQDRERTKRDEPHKGDSERVERREGDREHGQRDERREGDREHGERERSDDERDGPSRDDDLARTLRRLEEKLNRIEARLSQVENTLRAQRQRRRTPARPR